MLLIRILQILFENNISPRASKERFVGKCLKTVNENNLTSTAIEKGKSTQVLSKQFTLKLTFLLLKTKRKRK